MMMLTQAANNILHQLAGVVEQITEEDFRRHSDSLHATIGQHLRHTLEFFICLEQGYILGIVNYDKRIHDKTIENDKSIALQTIRQIQEFVKANNGDKSLRLEAGYRLDSDQSVSINSNYLRELVYNIEHAVHHMAIMKIGILEVANYIKLPADFGIAASTLRYKEAVLAAQ
jgi:transcriptional regulator of heat shock response